MAKSDPLKKDTNMDKSCSDMMKKDGGMMKKDGRAMEPARSSPSPH